MPANHEETKRVASLKALNLLDSSTKKAIDNICQLTSQIFGTPIAIVSLIDEEKPWFKSTVGLSPELMPQAKSLCEHLHQKTGLCEIDDTSKDTWLSQHALVTNSPNIRFYAGIPLKNQHGCLLGGICIMDYVPRTLTEKQRQALTLLAEQTICLMDSHYHQHAISKLYQDMSDKLGILQKISNGIPCMLSYWDKNQICLYADDSYCKQLNKRQFEVIGQPYDVIVPNNLAHFIKPYFLRAMNGEDCAIELSDAVYKSNDDIRLFQYLPNVDQYGQVHGVLSMISNVTDTHSPTQNTAIFNQVVSHSSDSILITDADYKTEYVNPSFTRLTQYEIGEALGQEPDFLFSNHQPKTTFAQIKNKLKTSKVWKGDIWHSKKDGSIFYALVSIDVISDNQNQVTNYIFSLRDQTDNEKVRAELFSMTDMLKRTGKMAKVGGWEINLITKKILWTDEMFSIHELPKSQEPSFDEAIKFYPPESRNVVLSALEYGIKMGTSWDLEVPFTTARNNRIWVRTTGECIYFDNKPYKLTGTFQDITERKLNEIKKKEDEINHRNTLVKEVHHRIKNNLQGVSGLLSNFAALNPNQAELFNEANSQLQSVAVIYGLQGQSPDASIELSELTLAICNNIQALWQTNITLNIDNDWVMAHVEKEETVPMALIINELVTNAAKHQTDDHSVKISLMLINSGNNNTQSQQKVLLSVSNAGNYLETSESTKGPQKQSGLALMSTLMPKRGAYIKWGIDDNHTVVSLELAPPVIKFKQSIIREDPNDPKTKTTDTNFDIFG